VQLRHLLVGLKDELLLLLAWRLVFTKILGVSALRSTGSVRSLACSLGPASIVLDLNLAWAIPVHVTHV